MPHTPGPWAWRRLGGAYHLVADHGSRQVILTASIDNSVGDWDPPGRVVLLTRDPASGTLVGISPATPNARLIAAAPDLLAACAAVLAWADRECMPQGGQGDGPWEAVEAALRKAKGE